MKELVVDAKNIKKYFKSKRGVVKAVNGVNLQVRAGEIYGFLGPNGAGKTTTLRMLTTLITPDSGNAIVAGYDVRKDPDQTGRPRARKTLFYRVNFMVCQNKMQ
jgi:ABC-2 type transport system ATP-binding protein